MFSDLAMYLVLNKVKSIFKAKVKQVGVVQFHVDIDLSEMWFYFFYDDFHRFQI